MSIPESLIQQLATGRIVPFVGSGVSMAVERNLFPAWPELLELLASKLLQESNEDAAEIVKRYVNKNQLNKAANEALDELGLARFRDVMRGTFGVDRPEDATLELPAALWSLGPRLVVTTNYDRVLQWSNPAAVVATNSQKGNLADLFNASTSAKPFVWHLHGHIDDPDSLILAPQQYDQLYRETVDDEHPWAAARLQLRTLIGNHALLFVGFGLEDEYVMDALASVLGIFGGKLRPSYALLKAGDDRARTLWDKHAITVIEYADYGEPLVELVTEIARRTSAAGPTGAKRAVAGPPVIPAAYVQWLTEQCADITPFGMSPAQGQSVCLQQVYVPPLSSSRPKADMPGEVADASSSTGRRKRKRRGRQESSIDSFDEQSQSQVLLDLLGEHSLYVSGGPGTGKSTFCRWVAWLAATGEMPAFEVEAPEDYQEKLPDSLSGRLPVLVRLREFREFLPTGHGRNSLTASQFEQALQGWLDHARPGGLSWKDVAPHVSGGSLLLILDGVDELPLVEGDDRAAWSPRESLLSGLTAAAGDWLTRGNRLLVTSRPYGVTPDQVRQLDRAGLAEARLYPLPDALQELLAARWFVALPKTSAEGRRIATEMLDQVRALTGDVAELATNPLLLTAVCIIYGEGKELPRDKHNLYDRIVNTALHSRYAHGPNLIAAVRARLAAVALGIHTGDPHQPGRTSPVAEVTYEELDQILSAYIDATPETESGFRRTVDAREDLLSHSGLLSQGKTQRAGFYHLSFQEFLAAERLVLLNPDEERLLAVFRERSRQSGWRPTLSFLFGSRVAQPGWRAGVDLLERMLAATDTGNFQACLGLALSSVDALEILLDLDLQLQEPLLDRVREIALAAIRQEVDLEPRVELAHMLGRVGDPRVAHHLNHPDAWVDVPAGEYPIGDTEIRKEYSESNALALESFTLSRPIQLSKYPVTNAQFRQFVEDGGYGQQSLWQAAGWRWREENNVTEPVYWQDSKWNAATQPVVGVSWWEADAFCRWADCRLPTEREWEAAARGPQGLRFPWKGDGQDGICNSSEADLGVTTPVGVFPQSVADCGAHDMAGNVWEWCSDTFVPDRREDVAAGRVLRGGSWFYYLLYCRSAVRLSNVPGNRVDLIGFRAARTKNLEP